MLRRQQVIHVRDAIFVGLLVPQCHLLFLPKLPVLLPNLLSRFQL